MTVEELITDPTLRPLFTTSQTTLIQTLDILTWLSKTLGSQPDQEFQLTLSRLQKSLFSLLAQLRIQNRRAAFGVRSTKQETAEARQEVDRLLLQLQNLYYEQRHLMGEISACEIYEYVFTIFSCHVEFLDSALLNSFDFAISYPRAQSMANMKTSATLTPICPFFHWKTIFNSSQIKQIYQNKTSCPFALNMRNTRESEWNKNGLNWSRLGRVMSRQTL